MKMTIKNCSYCKNPLKEEITWLCIRHIEWLPMEFLCEKCGKEIEKIEIEMLIQNRKNKVKCSRCGYVEDLKTIHYVWRGLCHKCEKIWV